MKCVWTQKVSLLIDGELDRAGAREVEQHLDSCADCREARADFLSLRRQIAAYRIETDAFAAQRALREILAAGTSGARAESERDGANSRARRGGRFAGVFGMPRLSPAGLAALLLLLVGVAAGIISLNGTRRPATDDVAHAVPTPAPSADARRNPDDGAQPAPLPTPNDSTAGAKSGGESIAKHDPNRAGEAAATRTGEAPAKDAGGSRPAPGEQARGRAPRVEQARRQATKATSSQQSPPFGQLRVEARAAEETAGNNVEPLDEGAETDAAREAGGELTSRAPRDASGDSKTARHVEQAQLLLRSFRNTRLADAGRRASTDLAYDKRQSKKLLYQNIVLRREAASRGNLPMESLLDSLEPILIDIANLPDRPAPEDVREINERMRRKNLVAMLQISSVESASARSY